MTRSELDEAIEQELGIRGDRHPATELVRIANRFSKHCPKPIDEMMDLIGDYLQAGFPKFALATNWAKRRADLVDLAHFDRVEEWLETSIVGWWECDQFCYRILNPFVDAFPELYPSVCRWATSKKVYVRRAAPVSFIAVGPPNQVTYPVEQVLKVCDLLLGDAHHHVQKGVGWVLKCAWSTYPDEVVSYLEGNVGAMSRTTFRYALGRMPKELHAKLLSL